MSQLLGAAAPAVALRGSDNRLLGDQYEQEGELKFLQDFRTPWWPGTVGLLGEAEQLLRGVWYEQPYPASGISGVIDVLPVILFNSATGSDTAASGAGPDVALSGTNNCSTDGTGTIVTLPAGTDLTFVKTDGSHVLFFDAIAGGRNFAKIVGSSGNGSATPTVKVSPALDTTQSNKSWAIGGVRAFVETATSRNLFENGGIAGDAMPGWIVELQSGHAETLTATLTCRRAGDSTTGPITLRGAAGGTRPVLTWSNDGQAFVWSVNGLVFQFFEMRNSAAGKTASAAFASNNPAWGLLVDITVNHATNFFRTGASNGSGNGFHLLGCDFGYAGLANLSSGSGGTIRAFDCFIHDSAGHGADVSAGNSNLVLYNSIVSRNAGDGVRGGPANFCEFINSTFDANGSDGLEFTSTSTPVPIVFVNNIVSNNGGYGMNFSGGSLVTSPLISIATFSIVAGNDYYGNVLGTTNVAVLQELGQQAVNPAYANAAGNDYSIAAALRALGFPQAVIGTLTAGQGGSSTRSYMDPGAAQTPDRAGAVGTVIGQGVRRGSFY